MISFEKLDEALPRIQDKIRHKVADQHAADDTDDLAAARGIATGLALGCCFWGFVIGAIWAFLG